ncbi:hypothetical protein ANN_04228 [Periplaneta americana]|uniref:Uncharacterized protein n=1 Tax=Periplaneta americana TaxID=6978 RepID=A0ABQ8T9J2_PERAM|nr:hypothetical protein ANN_04228 [Periplaneta americana]
MWIWRRMERVKWTDRIRNEAVLERVGEERMKLKLIRKRKKNWLGQWLRRNCLLKDALEGMVNGRRVRGRRNQMIDDIKKYRSYEETKRKAENRKDWRKLGLHYPAFARIGLRKNSGKKPQLGNLPRSGFEPGPPGFAVRRADRYSTGVDFSDDDDDDDDDDIFSFGESAFSVSLTDCLNRFSLKIKLYFRP